MVKYSGLQKEVLSFYRQCMRCVRTKPKNNQEHWRVFIRAEFEKSRHIQKRKFGTIEHLIRTGHKRYEMYSSDAITDVH